MRGSGSRRPTPNWPCEIGHGATAGTWQHRTRDVGYFPLGVWDILVACISAELSCVTWRAPAILGWSDDYLPLFLRTSLAGIFRVVRAAMDIGGSETGVSATDMAAVWSGRWIRSS